jgi:predicted outer membrane repeat protein
VRGGAVYCDASAAVIANNDFEDNSSAYGGAIWCSGLSSLTITGNEFKTNDATMSGGAVVCRGSSPTIDGNLFEQNTAAFDGGAVYCDQASPADVTNNVLRDNAAGGNGGGIAYLDSPLSIGYNLFRGNTAALGGGVYGSDALAGGDITNNTFDANGADNGAGICLSNNSRPAISNTIVSNSTSGEPVYTKNDSSPTISCCCFYLNAGGDALPPGSFDGGGNFSADPEYCGIDGSGNYYLQADSPCGPGINHGGKTCTGIGAFPIQCGTTSVRPATWGAVKEMYRSE